MEEQNSTRRSSRNRIPNNIYAEGIQELRRSLNVRDPKKKSKPSDSEDSVESSRKQDDESFRNDDTEWLKCILPVDQHTNRQIAISIVISKSSKRKYSQIQQHRTQNHKYVEPLPQQASRKMVKKASSSLSANQKPGLLELLFEAAQKVANEDPQVSEPKKNIGSNNARLTKNASHQQYDEQEKVVLEKPYVTVSKKQSKETRDDRQGRILKVHTYQDRIVFEHSKRGEIQIPFDKESQNQPVSVDSPSRINIAEIKRLFDDYKSRTNSPLILI